MNQEPIKHLPFRPETGNRKSEISEWLVEAACLALCVAGIVIALILL